MPLNQNKLKNNLIDWIENPYSIKVDALDAFTNAYDSYAQDAVATSGGSFVSANSSGLLSTLLTLPDSGTPQIASDIFANAISLYWTGAILTPSTVSVTLVPATLSAQLLSIFSDLNPERTYEQIADLLSTAFHTATLTVQTINPTTTPSPTPGVLS